jgi:hypothetical protein
MLQPDSIKYRCNFYGDDVIPFSRSVVYEMHAIEFILDIFREVEDFT